MSVVATKCENNKCYVAVDYHIITLKLYGHVYRIFEKLLLLKKFGDVRSTTFRPLPWICVVVQHS